MFRRWLIALTLVGFALTGVAMSTHISTSAHPVDAVVASAHSLSEPAHVHGVQQSDGDHAMLTAVGCAFVAVVTALLVVLVRLVRPWASVWMLLPKVWSAHNFSARAVVTRPPDLLALGISRT